MNFSKLKIKLLLKKLVQKSRGIQLFDILYVHYRDYFIYKKRKKQIYETLIYHILHTYLGYNYTGIMKKKVRVISITEALNKNMCSVYKVVEIGTPQSVVKPCYYKKTDKIKRIFQTPDIYLAEFSGADILFRTNIVIKNNFCIYDMCANDTEERYDLTIPPFYHKTRTKGAINRVRTDNIEYEWGILLCDFCSFNYFHNTYEVFAKLTYIDRFEIYRTWPIFLDECVKKTPQFIELLSLFNVHRHPIIWLAWGRRYHVKRLLYMSPGLWLPYNVKNRKQKLEDFMIHESLTKNIRECILPQVKLKKSSDGKKIFLSRKNTSNARLANQTEVEEKFIEYGFELVYMENLSVKEQIVLFRNAEYVAGSTGAAFTNILYCNAGTKMICIVPMEMEFYMFSTIGEQVGLKMVFLDANYLTNEKYASGDQYVLDMKYCENFLIDIDEVFK